MRVPLPPEPRPRGPAGGPPWYGSICFPEATRTTETHQLEKQVREGALWVSCDPSLLSSGTTAPWA